MTPQQAELALFVLKAAEVVANQLATANLDEISPEMKAELLDRRDAVNARFASLMPKG